ncbi:MAG: RDD family protein [Candidatus Dormibacteria bacterium]
MVDTMSWQPPSAPPSGGYAPTPGGYAPPPGYPQYPSGPYGRPGPGPGLEYASFWRRFGGYLIDILVIAVPSVIVFFVLYGSSISTYANQVTYASQNGLASPVYQLPSGAAVTIALISCVLSALYFGVLVAGWGSTVGQRAVGLRVVRQEDTTQSLPVGRALARAVVWWGAGLLSFVSGVGTIVELVVFLCLLWVAWDPQKQGLHDKLGRALVVRPGLPPVTAFGPPAYPYPAPGYPSAPPQYPPAPPQYPPSPPQYPPAPSQYPPAPSQ